MKAKLLVWMIGMFLLAAVAHADINDNMTNCWDFEDTKLYDYYGNASLNTSTGVSTAQFDTGKIGNAVVFDGSTYYLENATPKGLAPGAQPFTLSMWLYYNGTIANSRAFGWGNTEDTRRVFVVGFDSSGFELDVVHYSDDWDNIVGWANKSWVHLIYTYDGATTEKLYLNGTYIATNELGGAKNHDISPLRIGSSSYVSQIWTGKIDVTKVWRRVITDGGLCDNVGDTCGGEIAEDFNLGAGTSCASAAGGVPEFSNSGRNVTNVFENSTVQFNITATSDLNISTVTFSTTNGTGSFMNISVMDFDNKGTIINASYNITLYNASGTVWQWKWYANNTEGSIGESSSYTLTIGGTVAPNITIQSHNFFNSKNQSVINFDEAKSAIINLSFEDNIDLYGFEMNITNANGTTCWNWTNTTLNGTLDNFTKVADLTTVCEDDGYYYVNITAWDSHTSNMLKDMDVKKGDDYLLFDDKIKITAEDAKKSDAEKKKDRYTFEFEYDKDPPKKKVFYLESDGKLDLKTTKYKAHFVDWKNKKWIDFEGIAGNPTITKVSDKKYKIEFDDDSEKVVLQSIGGLNSWSSIYFYYLVHPTPTWYSPTTTTAYFANNQIAVSLNVTSNYRNETRFRIYNSSHDLVDSYNVSDIAYACYGSLGCDVLPCSANAITCKACECSWGVQYPTYLYNATFTGLTDTTYYVNATHFLNMNSTVNSSTLTLYTAWFNISIYDEVTDTVIDNETITLEVASNDFAANYTSTNGHIGVGGWADGEYRIAYTATQYAKRTYYYTLGNLTNHSLRLYLLSLGNGTDVTFTIQDSSGNELNNATIRMMKYYVSTNSYRTVAMARTNAEGEAVIDVDYNDAFYQMLVTYGNFNLITIGAKIITTAMRLTMDLIADPFTVVDALDNIVTSLTFNSLTQTFTYTFNDLTGTSRTGTLEVYRITPREHNLVCTNTDTSASASLLCQVNTTNTTGSYSAHGMIDIPGGSNIITNTLEIATGYVKEFSETIGNQGVFFSLLIAGAFAGLGAFVSPAVGIIMFLVGLGATLFFGFSMLTTSVYISIILIGAFIIYKIK